MNCNYGILFCKKINAIHPAFANLAAYFRFDEGTTNTTGGFAGNFGSLINSPTWQTSGAALGDASAHDYINVAKSASINASSGEVFTATSSSGTPNGIQVYRVDGQPSVLTGTTGVGSNKKYFGVFQVGGTLPQYTAVYNYNGNPGVTTANENILRLFRRNDNAAASWSLLTTPDNEPANTITVTGQSTEYILGTTGTALNGPVNWTGNVSTDWETAANWEYDILPNASTDVIVNSGRPFYPLLGSNVSVRSVKINPGSSMIIRTGFRLTVLK
jgi:hypothetical protein